MIRKAVILVLLLTSVLGVSAQTLQSRLMELTESFPSEAGIALLTPSGKIIGVNRDKAFPLLSVMKFHQALSVCQKLREEGRNLMETVHVTPSDLKPDTYSPMRDKYPQGGDFFVFEIIEYALMESDNNAADLLFRIAPAQKVTRYVKDLGIEGCQILYSEDEIHQDPGRSYENASTPDAAVRLLESFFLRKDTDGFLEFLYDTMKGCQTGENRIPRHISGLVPGITHKTGTGFPTLDGKISAVNDIALILLPDGSHCSLSVFLKDAASDMDSCEALIAQVGRVCVDYLLRQE